MRHFLPHLNLTLDLNLHPRLACVGELESKIRIKIKSTKINAFLLLAMLASASVVAAEPNPASDPIEFFEQRIRPLLIDSCYKCHSAESGKSKGGLRLDTKAAVLQGGDSGPALVPGQPDASLLIKAIRYTNEELQMPPDSAGGKLAPEKIADLEAWVKMGSPDPRTGPSTVAAPRSESIAAKARTHWAFQPVVAPAIPPVTDKAWVQTPVDAFVLAKLEAKGMKPAPPADQRTWLRRVHFDLTGLPPTAQEADDFLKDDSPDAHAKVVDRLLASPRYGERWGRYWLDVARYADTKGYVFQEERRYAFSHTYRDYVIRAFNEDVPYDRFLLEQIAADRLPAPKVATDVSPLTSSTTGDGADLRRLLPADENRSSLAALGFLTLGRRFLNVENDIIDDRIDVVMRGTQGLTVSCARCHDHKFDPISAKDYYALHGVFASSEEPAEKPLLGLVRDPAAYDDYLKQKAKIEAQMEAVIQTEVDKFLAEQRAKTGDYLLAARDAKTLPKDANLETFAGERKVTLEILRRWMAFLEERSKGHDPVLAPWFALAALPENEFAAAASELGRARLPSSPDSQTSGLDRSLALPGETHGDGRGENLQPAPPLVAQAFASNAPASLKDVAATYNKLFAEADQAWVAAREAARKAGSAPPSALADREQEAIRALLHADKAPPNLPPAEARRIIERHLDNVTVSHRQQVEALQWTHPGVPPRAMAITDKSKPRNSRVLIRGNPGNPGAEVPRRFLEVLAGSNAPPFTDGSGRLELARAIASRDNPLTARVFVNRVWGWRFGAALVRTPSDFGVRTEAPVQRDLLDWLAATFMDGGWSPKKLHRVILLSNTYRQSSTPDPHAVALDPENQLLHHFNRRRLDFEAMRDTLLAASGRLDLTAGGLPVDILKEPFSGRRTVYGFIDRQNLPGLFRTFDFANPDATSPQRFATTVPQQALFLMNSPFVVEQARALMGRPEMKAQTSEATKLRALYALVYQREPDREERRRLRDFLNTAGRQPGTATVNGGWQLGSGWFESGINATAGFATMNHFTADRASPEAAFPLTDDRGHLSLTAAGGHPGNTPQWASIRRWTAPASGRLDIDGTLQHASADGDGVRGRIVSSRAGKLGEWRAANSAQDTALQGVEVMPGDTLDFIVDCVAGPDSDSFAWAPAIRLHPAEAGAVARTHWKADEDFGPPQPQPAPLKPWERLAQTLLLANEFAFLD